MADDPQRPSGNDAPPDLPADATMTFGRAARAAEDETSATQLPGLPTISVRMAEDPATLAPEASSGVPAQPTGATYRLQRLIARGGMGEVWEATQTALARTVAVKRIRMLESDPVRRRGSEKAFREEAVISARLEHPNIVPVHDLGADEDGSPLLAMKLIEGTSWSEELRRDFDALPPDAYLARHIPILMAVGQAVAFAHSRGIVHRDLKPQQVMLGGYGEVLLTDWGLAMLVDRAGASAPSPGGTGLQELALPGPDTASSPSGTPAFMAPEQTLPSARSIGFHTDVFLLGATLYMVLTGRAPHEGRTPLEVFCRAAESNVTPPSARVKGTRAVPQDLEELCMRCLRKEPADRLGSAREFVAALHDYTTGAGRRRESAALAERAASLLARGGEDYALFAEVTALTDQARLLWPENPALAGLRREALARHARLAERGGDLRLARLLAEQLEAGDPDRHDIIRSVTETEECLASQAQQRRRLAAAVILLLAAMLAGASVTSVTINRARSLAEEREQQVRSARSDSEQMLQFMLGDLRTRLAELERLDILNEAGERALEYYERQPFDAFTSPERLDLVTGLNDLVVLLSQQGRADLLERAATLGAGMVERQATLEPGTTSSLHWVRLSHALRTRGMMALAAQGRLKEARERIAQLQAEGLKALEAGTLDAGTWANMMVNCATVLGDSGDRDGARAILVEAKNRLDALPGDAVANAGLENERIGVLRHLANIETLSGNVAAAGELLPEVLQYARRNYGLDPSSEAARRALSQALLEMGRHCRATQRNAEAAEMLREALAIQEVRIAANPANLALVTGKLVIVSDLCHAYEWLGQADAALALLDAAIPQARRLAAEMPGDSNVIRNLTGLISQKSTFLARAGRTGEAVALMEENVRLLRGVVEARPTRQERLALAATLNYLGIAYRNSQRPAEAVAAHREALALSKALSDASPADLNLRLRMAESLAFLGGASEASLLYADAEASYRECIAITDAVLAEEPATAAAARLRNSVRVSLATALVAQGKVHEAAAAGRINMEATRAALRAEPGSAIHAQAFASAATGTAGTLARAGDLAGARALVDEAVAALEAFTAANPGRLPFDETIAAHVRRITLHRRTLPDPDPSVFAAALAVARASSAEATLTLRARNETSDAFTLAAEEAAARGREGEVPGLIGEARAAVRPALADAATSSSAAIVAADVEMQAVRIFGAMGRHADASAALREGLALLAAADADRSVRTFARRTVLDGQLVALENMPREDFRTHFGAPEEAIPAALAALAETGVGPYDAMVYGLRVRAAVARELRLSGAAPEAILDAAGVPAEPSPEAERSVVEATARILLERGLARKAQGADATVEAAAVRAAIVRLGEVHPYSEATLLLALEAVPLAGDTIDLAKEYTLTKATRGILRHDLREAAAQRGW